VPVTVGEYLSFFKVSPQDSLDSFITLIIVGGIDKEERNLVEEGIFAILEAGHSLCPAVHSCI
jgi:hypothetical protein